MNALATRDSGIDPETDRTTPESSAADQPSISFDARARLRGAFDDVTVRQAVEATPADATERHTAAGY